MEKIEWAISVDKLRLCINMPENLFYFFQKEYTSKNEKIRIIDEQYFHLVFLEEDKKKEKEKKEEEKEKEKITANLNVRDDDIFFELGTFTFMNTDRYKNQAFFEFSNCALYRIFNIGYDGTPNNYIGCLSYVLDYYSMKFNNVTEVEIAFDANFNYVTKTINAIKNINKYNLFLNGKLQKDDEKLVGYGEYNERETRTKLTKTPTLYFHHAKSTDMEMKIYDKHREINEKSQYKKYIKDWLNWKDLSKIFRIEVTWRNSNVREALQSLAKIKEEWSEHENFLNLILQRNFLMAMLLDGAKRLVYFKKKKTGEELSVFELARGI